MVGEVRDQDGKLTPGVTVVLKSGEYGTTYELKTDSKGQFAQGGLRPGIYTVTLKDAKGAAVFELKASVTSSGKDPLVEINLKEINVKEAEARKKQVEEQAKFESMKAHFDAGTVALNDARQVREQIQHTPADQRAPLREKLAGLQKTAVGEYEAAQKAAPEKDPYLHLVLAKLAEAYESSGRYDEAAASYEKGIALKPNEASYYVGWGTTIARAGKVAEAGAACEKVAATDKATGATCWRNVGIVLQIADNMKDSVGPLRKSAELDPKNAQTWFLLGRALVNTMGFKQEGDKVIPILQPGTVEAYQKCIELDPNGSYGAQARAGLQELEAYGLGIETKVKAKKK
jgi:tetratricopeptide (TPR) repeat protein